MSLLQWFSRKPRRERGSEIHAAASGARSDADLHGEMAVARRSERTQRREQLYGVVRDAMVRVGILSAGYKFKVLALDAAGHRFVIMVDLAPTYAVEASRLKDIEGLIAELAKARLQAIVSAVYWRVGDQLRSTVHAEPAGQGGSRMAPLQGLQPQTVAAKASAPAGSGGARSFEPIDAQEMDAFRQAIAAAAAQDRRESLAPAAHAAGVKRSGPLLGPGASSDDGPDFATSDLGLLGVTQYGELR